MTETEKEGEKEGGKDWTQIQGSRWSQEGEEEAAKQEEEEWREGSRRGEGGGIRGEKGGSCYEGGRDMSEGRKGRSEEGRMDMMGREVEDSMHERTGRRREDKNNSIKGMSRSGIKRNGV